MRALLLLLLAPFLGCGQQQSDPQPNIVGDWVAVGAYASEGITVSFEKDGDVTIASKSTKPVTMRYRIERIAGWYRRRAKEIGQVEGDPNKLFPGVSHVIRAHPAEFSNEFNPSHNYFYNPTVDTLSVSGVFELRRKP